MTTKQMTAQATGLLIAMTIAFSMGFWYQGYTIYKGIVNGYADMMPKLEPKLPTPKKGNLP